MSLVSIKVNDFSKARHMPSIVMAVLPNFVLALDWLNHPV